MRQNLFKVPISILLLMLLTSCGKNFSAPTSTLAVVPSPTEKRIGSDNINLEVYSPTGVYCLSDAGAFPFNVEGNSNFPQGTLVLSTHRLNYDNSEIQQMSTYLTAYFNEQLPLPAPPRTLTYAKLAGNRCKLQLELTNIGNSTIQLLHIQLKLLAAPRRNTNQYFEVDTCSIPVPPSVHCSGGGGDETPWNYEFHLIGGGTGQRLTSLVTPETQNEAGLGPLLHPNGTAAMGISIYSLSKPFLNANNLIGTDKPNEYFNNSIYSLVPEIVLKIQGKVQTIELSKFASNLYFTKLCQFVPYGLKGNIFAREPCNY